MPISLRTCRCLRLHTYPAYVTADSWEVVVHVCHCGREHINDPLPAPMAKPLRKRSRKRRARHGG